MEQFPLPLAAVVDTAYPMTALGFKLPPYLCEVELAGCGGSWCFISMPPGAIP